MQEKKSIKEKFLRSIKSSFLAFRQRYKFLYLKKEKKNGKSLFFYTETCNFPIKSRKAFYAFYSFLAFYSRVISVARNLNFVKNDFAFELGLRQIICILAFPVD